MLRHARPPPCPAAARWRVTAHAAPPLQAASLPTFIIFLRDGGDGDGAVWAAVAMSAAEDGCGGDDGGHAGGGGGGGADGVGGGS